MAETAAFLRIAMDLDDSLCSSRSDFSIYRHPQLAHRVGGIGFWEAYRAYRIYNYEQAYRPHLNEKILELPYLASLDFDPGDGTNAAENLRKQLQKASQHKAFRIAMCYAAEVAWKRERGLQDHLKHLQGSTEQVPALMGKLVQGLA